MSSDETSGVAADVGVRKRNPEGEVVQEEGYLAEQGHTLRGWVVFALMTVLSVFGVWQILELIGVLG